jgi:hypothetical protein
MIRAIHFLALQRSTIMAPGISNKNVGQVKHAYAEAVDAIAKAQIGTHSEISEGNVDAIDVVHDIDEEHEGK